LLCLVFNPEGGGNSLLHSGSLLGLVFNPEDGGNMMQLKVFPLSVRYKSRVPPQVRSYGLCDGCSSIRADFFEHFRFSCQFSFHEPFYIH
jgi:hypothetical protein